MNGRAFFLFGLLIALFFSCKESTQTLSEGDYITENGTTIYTGKLSDDVVVRVISLPGSLHPTNGRTTIRKQILDLTSQKLINLDIKTGEWVPILVKEVPKAFDEGGTSYTVELDPAATWPDGQTITAEDVLFSYKAAFCPLTQNPQQKGYGEYLENISLDEANPNKIKFTFHSYYINNLSLTSLFHIIDKRVYDPKGLLNEFTLSELKENEALKENEKIKAWAEEFNKSIYSLELPYINAASGPYELEKWVTDQEIVLKRRENYWGAGKEVYFHHQSPPKIVFKALKEADALELQIAGEKIDIAEISGESMRRLMKDDLVTKNYTITSKERPSFVSLPLNNKPTSSGHSPFFVDKKVRQAVAYALPIEELVHSFLGDERFAIRIGSPVSSLSPDYNPNLTLYPHDPEKAKALLTEAGWEDSNGNLTRDKQVNGKQLEFEFTMIFPANNQSLIALANQIKEELAKVGISCTLDGLTGANLQKRLWTHDYDMGMLGLGSTHLYYDFDQLFLSENWPEGDNIYGFAHEEADDLIRKSRTEKDAKKRKAMVDRIQEILYDEKPCIFLYAPTKKLSIHKRFNNAEAYSISDHFILNDFEVIRPE